MTQRINISIPESLYERLQTYKDSINVSKVCQDALLAEIKKKEEFVKRVKENSSMTEVIERLKKERIQKYFMFYDIGREDGFEWAKVASYNELIEEISATMYPSDGILTFPSFYEFIETKYDIKTIDDDTGDDRYALLPYYELRVPEMKISEKNFYEIEGVYEKGLHESIKEFWKEIFPLLNDPYI